MEWVGLTEEELIEITERLKFYNWSIIDYYLMINEKLKEKNYKSVKEE